MNKSTILFVGFSKDIVTVLENQFTKGWISSFADSNERAIEKFQQLHYDAVVVDSTMEGTEILYKLFTNQQPQILFIQTAGIPEADDILQQITASRKENKPAINYNDDALKNAGLNINIQ
jgi:CheY-like chemotaxis protein